MVWRKRQAKVASKSIQKKFKKWMLMSRVKVDFREFNC